MVNQSGTILFSRTRRSLQAKFVMLRRTLFHLTV